MVMFRVGGKLAVFDFDGTLVRPKDGRMFPKDTADWQWLRPSVPEVVRNYAATHEIVIRSDQSKSWKLTQINNAMKEIGVPYTAVIATTKEYYKPDTRLFKEAFSDFDLPNSFYVGDAAGREGDWASVDKEFSDNMQLKFIVPEDIFPLPTNTPPSQSLNKSEREVVIMVGYPASGKTTIGNSLIQHGYVRIDGDTLKTASKMKKEAAKYIQKSSVIFDATNGTVKKRAEYIAFAKAHDVPVRAIVMKTSIEDAMMRNKERAHHGGTNIPAVAFYTFRKHYETPAISEGLTEITEI
jgi:bifunctional polynucleotide phosphatase/kinase